MREGLTRPQIAAPQLTNIPQELKAIPQWVVWRGFLKEDGKIIKIPYSLDGKYRASFKKHHSFDAAIDSLQKGLMDGVGFALSKEAGYICIDLDADSLDDIPASLKSIANYSYAERSPSGNGLHIWFKGEWPGEKADRGKEIRQTQDGYKVECYYETGYLTMTGDVVNKLDIEENQLLIDFIYNSTKRRQKEPHSPKILADQSGAALKDEVVLEMVLRNKVNRILFTDGDLTKFGNDHSKADYALCRGFAKVTNDAGQIKRLFEHSALQRAESEKHKDYLPRTIAKAMLAAAVEKEKELLNTVPEVSEKEPEALPEPIYFGGEKGTTFIPKWLGDDILGEYPVIYNGSHLFIYKNGVYHRDSGGIIGNLVVQKLGDMFKRDRLNETISYLRNSRWLESETFDAHSELINVKNGLLEWKTGVMHPHTPEHLSTIQLPVSYNPDAQAPNIRKFLDDIVSGDTIPTLYEWFGYSMIPSTRHEKAVILTGSGSNGKSKFIELYQRFIGESNISNVSLQELESNRFKLAQLQGKLANVYADISSEAMEKTSVFKTVVSGDRVSAEFKGRDSFDFKPFARLTFSANELPKSRDLTDGYFRRLIIVDFPNKFGTNGLRKDPHIMEKVSTEEELSGLLNLALNGLRRLETNGEFTENESTFKAIGQYKREIDPLVSFIEECCCTGADASVDRQELYDSYVAWTQGAGVKPLGKIRFYGRLEKDVMVREYRPSATAKRRFKGISLLDGRSSN